MGTIYARGPRLWIGYVDVSGKRRYVSTGLCVGDEAKARKLLEKVEAKVTQERSELSGEEGPLTVRRYLAQWTEARIKRELASAKDDRTRLTLHAMPRIGDLLMREVRPRHIRELIESLKVPPPDATKTLAPRTVRHVYGALHSMFASAHAEELVDNNPCVVPRGVLPKNMDKDPTWRSGAIFSRDEVVKILGDPRVPADRRAVYALMFLGGLRFGEAAALRWRHYDRDAIPLGKLTIAAAYDTKRQKEKRPKAETPREMPVHRALASVLAHWRDDGWIAMLGRKPGPDDLIVPSREGKHRNVGHAHRLLGEDLDRLGLRRRRQHDARRTLISLARADGARGEVLEWCTHSPKGNIMDLYTTLPWATFCEEVAKLRIDPPPRHRGMGGPAPGRPSQKGVLHPVLQSSNPLERLQDSSGEGGIRTRGTL